jgi:hypothetical protein
VNDKITYVSVVLNVLLVAVHGVDGAAPVDAVVLRHLRAVLLPVHLVRGVRGQAHAHGGAGGDVVPELRRVLYLHHPRHRLEAQVVHCVRQRHAEDLVRGRLATAVVVFNLPLAAHRAVRASWLRSEVVLILGRERMRADPLIANFHALFQPGAGVLGVEIERITSVGNDHALVVQGVRVGLRNRLEKGLSQIVIRHIRLFLIVLVIFPAFLHLISLL